MTYKFQLKRMTSNCSHSLISVTGIRMQKEESEADNAIVSATQGHKMKRWLRMETMFGLLQSGNYPLPLAVLSPSPLFSKKGWEIPIPRQHKVFSDQNLLISSAT